MDIVSVTTNNIVLLNKKQFLRNNALSENTKDSYSSDTNHYIGWGGKFPSNSEMIGDYLTFCSEKFKASTIARRLKSIRAFHRDELPNYTKEKDPTLDSEVLKIMKGIQRKYGEAPKKAKPLLMGDIEIIYSKLKNHKGLHDCRNLAIILVGVGLALRCSEIVNVKYEHLKFTDKGLTLFIPFSKTDQTNKGETVSIVYSLGNICAIRSLKDWLSRSNIKEGYVFRGVSRVGNIFNRPLNKVVIHNIVKDVTEQCLQEHEGYSGHSLRRGFVTIAIRNKCSLAEIMKQGRWKDVQTMMGYYGENDSFINNGCSIIFGGSLD